MMCDKFSYKHFPTDELKECYNCCYYCSAVCPDLLDQSSDDDDEYVDDDVFENLPF